MKNGTKTTALFSHHQKLGAKMMEFGGMSMPLQYEGIVLEHHSVRKGVGVFDVSHMARIDVIGPGAEGLLDYLSTNVIAGKKEGTATYTVWCDEKGGAVDDLIVYRLSRDHFFVVVNASNREKDLSHLQTYSRGHSVSVTPYFEGYGILAVQGPEALRFHPEAEKMKPMRVKETDFEGHPITLATTGYTGEKGFEIYAKNEAIVTIWEALVSRGVKPIGLGARDTLRLEMGFALYGHELSEEIAPTESVSKWTVKLNDHDFLGKEAVASYDNPRYQFGVSLVERGIARAGAEVVFSGSAIGKVTSGSFSPTLSRGIALVMADRPLEEGEQVECLVRDRAIKGAVVKLPFIK